MALILAVNPGNRHNPTLSRLARELKGCEIVGAESCAVAISAIKKRVPDVLLLPAPPARGEADLMAHLRSIPGGVLTLKLPPVESADPVDLAKQIRELLTGVPAFSAAPAAVKVAPAAVKLAPPAVKVAPPAVKDEPVPDVTPEPKTSAHLLAAATAAVSWAHARRAQWSEPIETYDREEPREPAESDEPSELYAPIGPYEAIEHSDEPDESNDPSALFGAVSNGGSGRNIAALLPRAAAAAAVIGIAAAAVFYWRGASNSGVESGTANETPRPVEAAPQPIVPQPAATQEPAPDPLANASGRVAVSSPFEVSISEGGQPVPRDDQGRVVLAPGRHRLRFQDPDRGYDETRTVQVRPAETTTVTLTPETTIAVASNEPAEVLIDGTRVGETPYQGKVGLGAHAVTVRSAGAERQVSVQATSKPVQLEIDFSKP